MSSLSKYLEPSQSNLINYIDFCQSSTSIEDDNQILDRIKLFVNDHVKDILVLNIKEDKIFLKQRELNKLPSFVKNMLRFSENR